MQHSNLIYTHWPERQHHCCQSECASLSISKCPDEPFCCQRSAHGCCGESHQHKSPLNLNFVNSSHSVQRYQSWICNMRTVLEGWPAAARGGGGGGGIWGVWWKRCVGAKFFTHSLLGPFSVCVLRHEARPAMCSVWWHEAFPPDR